MTARRKPRRHVVDISPTDRAFDELAPLELRHLSRRHWTPVAVVVRAAALLAPTSQMRVLDVGAGIGKLCAIGALSAEATWFGVERHGSLVVAATRLSRALGVADHATFLHGDAFSIEWTSFDALYLYNPFELEPFPSDPTRHAYEHRVQVARAEDRLARLAGGVRVVTFGGFGGVMPPSFQLVYQERLAGRDLVLWIQRSRARRATSVS